MEIGSFGIISDVIGSSSGSPDARADISALKDGSIIQTRVLFVSDGAANLKTVSGELIWARLAQGVAIAEGDSLTLLISNNGQQTVLSVLENLGQSADIYSGYKDTATAYPSGFTFEADNSAFELQAQSNKMNAAAKDMLSEFPGLTAKQALFAQANSITLNETQANILSRLDRQSYNVGRELLTLASMLSELPAEAGQLEYNNAVRRQAEAENIFSMPSQPKWEQLGQESAPNSGYVASRLAAGQGNQFALAEKAAGGSAAAGTQASLEQSVITGSAPEGSDPAAASLSDINGTAAKTPGTTAKALTETVNASVLFTGESLDANTAKAAVSGAADTAAGTVETAVNVGVKDIIITQGKENPTIIAATESGVGSNAAVARDSVKSPSVNTEQAISSTDVSKTAETAKSVFGEAAAGLTSGALIGSVIKLFAKLGKDAADNGEQLREAGEKLTDRLLEIRSGLEKLPQSDNVKEQLGHVDRLIEGTRLFKEIDSFTYCQIPVWLNQTTGDAELYIYKKKKNSKTIDSGDTTVLVALDMDTLGHVETMAKIKGKAVSVRFTLSQEETAQFIGERSAELSHLLGEAGYRLTDLKVEKSTTSPISVTDALEVFQRSMDSVKIDIVV